MRVQHVVLVVLLLALGVVLTAGCMESGSPSTQVAEQQAEQQTEIHLQNEGLEVRIHPTQGKTVSGIITVEFLSVPENAGKLMVMLSPQGMTHTDNPFSEPNVVAQFVEPDVGQVFVNTSAVDNGVYNLAITAAPKEQREGYPWIAVVQTQVLVSN